MFWIKDIYGDYVNIELARNINLVDYGDDYTDRFRVICHIDNYTSCLQQFETEEEGRKFMVELMTRMIDYR